MLKITTSASRGIDPPRTNVRVTARAQPPSGAASVGDPWRGRSITLDADWARFTEADLDEASARLRRLAQAMALRLRALEPRWDDHAGDEWTIRSIAEHVADAMRVYASRPAATALVPPPA